MGFNQRVQGRVVHAHAFFGLAPLRLLRALGFVVDTEAMGEDQPFGNVVLVCRVPLAMDSATGGAIL